jgi:Flp pilus assembly protein TadB
MITKRASKEIPKQKQRQGKLMSYQASLPLVSVIFFVGYSVILYTFFVNMLFAFIFINLCYFCFLILNTVFAKVFTV